MPTGTAIARAYVQIVPSMRGVGESIVTAFQGHGLKAGKAAGQSATEGMRHGLAGMSAVFGAVSQLASKAMDTIGSSISGAVNRADVMNNFPKIMRNFGYSADDAKKSISSMSDAIDGLPTSLPALASMVQQLTPVTGSLKDATSISIAFNNALLAGGQSTQVQTNALIQYSQMLAAGKPDMMAWRSIEDAMPGQLNQVAKAMLGPTANSKQLYDAIKAGTVGFDDLNREMVRLNTQGSGQYASFAQQARDATQGIGTAVENVGNRIQKAIQGVIDAVGVERIAGTINQFSEGIRDVGNQVAQFAGRLMGTQGMRAFASAIRAIGTAAHGILGAINSVAAGFIGVKTGSSEAAAAGSAVGSVLGRLGGAARQAAAHVRTFFQGLDPAALRQFGQAARNLLSAIAQVAGEALRITAAMLGFDTSIGGARDGAAGFSQALGRVASALRSVGDWVRQNRVWLGALVSQYALTRVETGLLSAAHSTLSGVLQTVGAGAEKASGRWDSLVASLKNVGEQSRIAGRGVSSTTAPLDSIASGARKASSSASQLVGRLVDLDSKAAQTASRTAAAGEASAQAANMVGKVVTNATNAGTGMSRAASLASGFASALSRVSGIAGIVVGGLNMVIGVVNTVKAVQAADRQANDELGDTMVAAYQKGGKAVEDFWKKVNKGEAGQVNAATKIASVGSIKNLSGELKAAGVSEDQFRAAVERGGRAMDSLAGASNGHYKAMTANASAAGGDISKLHLSMRQLPKIVSTLLKTDGGALSRGTVLALASAIKSVPGTWTTRMGVTDRASKAIKAIGLSVKNTKDKTVTITGKNTKALQALAKVAGVRLKDKNTKITLTKKQFDEAMAASKGNLNSLKGKSIRIDAKGNVTAVAGKAKGAVKGVPGSHSTTFKATDAVSRAAKNAAGAVRGIPRSHDSFITQHGAGPARSAVERFRQALDGLPSSKTVTVNYVEEHSGGHANGGPIFRAWGGRVARFASGGFDGRVLGAGTATSDSIPAMLSNGEYVIRAASAQSLGLENLDRMNQTGRLPATIIRDDSADRALLAQLVGLRDDLRHLDGQKIVLDGRELGRAVEKYRI